MSSLAISLIVFACVFVSAMLGVFLRFVLPSHHLNGDSKSVVQVGMGLVGTLAAMVLGLLVASAKTFYDTQTTELTQLSANIVLLDRALAHYGPETAELRGILRGGVVHVLDRMWSSKDSSGLALFGRKNPGVEALYDKIQQLSPKDDQQREFKSQALSIANGLGKIRWLMYEQRAHSVSTPLLAVLVFWLMTIFMSFGLFAPPNTTVLASLFISALSVSGAILLLSEMYTPYAGLIHLSSEPLRAALASLGQ